jgi:hypothetical protein
MCFNLHIFKTKEASVNPFQRASPKLLEQMHREAVHRQAEDALL